MKNLFEIIRERIAEFRKSKPEKGAEYSMNKYSDTYKLLEEYDQTNARDPQTLADPGRLEDFIRDVSKAHRKRRTNS